MSGARGDRLDGLLDALAASGARLQLELPGGASRTVGAEPPLARVAVRTPAALRCLEERDALRLGEAYLAGEVDVEGDLAEALRVTFHLSMEATAWQRLRLWLRLRLRDRIAYDRESIAHHYDRPAEFFLPWLGRWRCYSHGLYAGPDDAIDVAMARKMQAAIDGLGLESGMRVLDMGGGWGCFVEYAGLQGIEVHAITISAAQHAFVSELIGRLGLPCSVELVNFWEHRPARPYDGAVFMGTLEHNPEYERVVGRVKDWLTPEAALWADFSAQRSDFTLGPFMKKHIWPGPISYVNPHAVVGALLEHGFNVHELADDTLSYAWTVRDWGDALESQRKTLAERFGEEAVRAFLLFLRGSYVFLCANRTQAYHLVGARRPRS